MRLTLMAGFGLALLCTTAQAATPASRFIQDPYPSTYRAIASPPVLISGATVLTGSGERIDNADVLLQGGKIAAVGSGLSAPADAIRVDGSGKWVTPGLIDVHSHLGVYPSPGMNAHSDGNEATAPVTVISSTDREASAAMRGMAPVMATVRTVSKMPSNCVCSVRW